MNVSRKRLPGAGLILLILTAAGFLWYKATVQHSWNRKPTAKEKTANPTGADLRSPKEVARVGQKNAAFPENDLIELPFLGKVPCHSRSERISFTANGRKLDWPFKVFYLPSGMFVRAEFVKPGAKDYEASRADIEELYRATGESLAGFPETAAPADLSRVLQSLYENEPFDRASKINITWILRKHISNGRILPCYIANIFGVSPGLMNVPPDDEGFLKYRILLTPEGEAVRTDNFL